MGKRAKIFPLCSYFQILKQPPKPFFKYYPLPPSQKKKKINNAKKFRIKPRIWQLRKEVLSKLHQYSAKISFGSKESVQEFVTACIRFILILTRMLTGFDSQIQSVYVFDYICCISRLNHLIKPSCGPNFGFLF